MRLYTIISEHPVQLNPFQREQMSEYVKSGEPGSK